MDIPVNYWAVLVAGVASFLLGGLWYGPIFGKAWIKLMGPAPDMGSAEVQASIRRGYVLTFLASLLTAYVLSHFTWYSEAIDMRGGASTGFWAWSGFMVPLTLSSVIWDRKPWKMFLIQNGYWLLSLIVMGAIVAAWR